MRTSVEISTGPAPAELANLMTANGYAVWDDFVPLQELREAQEFVAQAVARGGGEYVRFSGARNLGGTFLERLPDDPAFSNLCQGIYAEGVGRPAPSAEFYQILRCLSGSNVEQHSMRFHYDSYVLTALIPITMPSKKDDGRLILLRRRRRIRRLYVSNLLEKLLCDNALTQAILRQLYKRYPRCFIFIPLKPGNLYLFWGYQSLHTNEPCGQNEIRSTALLHYLDPHATSRLKRSMKAIRERLSSRFQP